MLTNIEILLITGMVAGLVYLTRISGYLLGLKVRHIGALRPILETLPGCALIAIIVPALHGASGLDMLAMAAVVGIMWVTNSAAIATIVGLGLLVAGFYLGY